MEHPMADIATDLKEIFQSIQLYHLEKWEMYGVNPDGMSIPDVWTDEENDAIDLLKILHDTVDAIPATLMKATEEVRNDAPELFEKLLLHGVQVVGFDFHPTSATEFVEVLNRTVQRDMAQA
jgi:hypothetical protein